jgi:hypothetical protein
MDPLFWLAAGAIPVVWSMTQKARGEAAWRAAMLEATRALGGGGVTSTPDGPRFTATRDGATVALRVRDVRHAARSIVTADVVLPAQAPSARLYLGWGVTAPPAELAHIPELETAARGGFKGRVYVRSDAPAVAERFVEAQAAALVDLRHRAGARALEVLVRGGRLHLALHGPPRAAATVLAMVEQAAALRRALEPHRSLGAVPSGPSAAGGPWAEDTAPTPPAQATTPTSVAEDTLPSPTAGGTRLDAPEAAGAARQLLAALAARAAGQAPHHAVAAPAARPDLACHLCGERTHAEPEAPWSRCLRCDAPYHARCWEVATGCVAPGCVETRSLPL